jgi:hypothetical protein
MCINLDPTITPQFPGQKDFRKFMFSFFWASEEDYEIVALYSDEMLNFQYLDTWYCRSVLGCRQGSLLLKGFKLSILELLPLRLLLA